MSEHVIKVPDIGEGIAEVELVAWHVKPGDSVVEDQALADVMTDKATVEVPCPVVGKVMSLGGEVGQVLAVGAELIRIETAIEVGGDVRPAVAPMPPARAELAQSQPAPAPARQSAPPAQATADRPVASPAVRRRAWELGVELDQVSASGSGGRIMQADLEAHVSAHGASARPRPPTAAASPVTPGVDQEEKVPVVGMRRRIAMKMQESKRRIPHYTYVEEIDVTELERLRGQLNQAHGDRESRLTVLPLLMRAVVVAIRDFPQMNARYDDDNGVVSRHHSVHLGVATQTTKGLMVPVVKNADGHDLWESADEVTRLSTAARNGKITLEELTGSTITISSLGALGGIVSTPIINYPEVAIIGVNKIITRPVYVEGAVVARQIMNLSSSFNHRVVDGADAAAFIQRIKALLETPALLFI